VADHYDIALVNSLVIILIKNMSCHSHLTTFFKVLTLVYLLKITIFSVLNNHRASWFTFSSQFFDPLIIISDFMVFICLILVFICILSCIDIFNRYFFIFNFGIISFHIYRIRLGNALRCTLSAVSNTVSRFISLIILNFMVGLFKILLLYRGFLFFITWSHNI